MPQFSQAHTSAEFDIVRTLLREYQQALGVDLCFQGFATELATLPGNYAPPSGRLIVARHQGEVMGCVALQRVDATRGEMKRLYVRPQARGLGLGRQLVTCVLDAAKVIGFNIIVLDTLPTMIEAQRLYEQFGFIDIEPYRANPIAGTRYLGKTL